MLGLMRVVNGDCRVEPLDWLALQRRKVYPLLKILLAQVVHPSKSRYFHSIILLYTQLSVQSTNKTKRTFEPRTRYCHIHLTCMSVRYERKMHLVKLLFESKIVTVKNIVCFNFVEVYELYKVFLHRNFQIYSIYYHNCATVRSLYLSKRWQTKP